MVKSSLSKNNNSTPVQDLCARQLLISGIVQGVGFRPFIYRSAIQHGLNGWVRNLSGAVEIHIQGKQQDIADFLLHVFNHKPALSRPVLEQDTEVELDEYRSFEILDSSIDNKASISVPVDLFLCDDCVSELNDPADRRYAYPFINCTQCGPRYTLIKKLPYDRANTTMDEFELCPECVAEYNDPSNRRFHAEPVACPECGPSVSFHQAGMAIKNNDQAINKAVTAFMNGDVIAVKGIGGYHLMCDATSTQAVNKLRDKKPRPDKPLAVMFPSPLDDPFYYLEQFARLTDQDRQFLLQPSRPVLLVRAKQNTALSTQVAPCLNEIGVMLPYSPLHHLLLNKFKGPLVATSANISGEPVLINNDEVEKKLSHVADACLHHNRAIQRPADDPVFRSIAGKPRAIRLGRGVAPMEIKLPFRLEHAVLAVGAQMKNVIALAWNDRVVISPHIGEMDSSRSMQVFEDTIQDFQKLYAIQAQSVICDAHPGYTTTRWAKQQGLSVHEVFHHHAHAAAAYYECMIEEDVMVFTWDGVGYGKDRTLWGGETLLGKPGQWQRAASMRPFHLPGGDKAGREPWRSAAAVCWETGQAYDDEVNHMLKLAWEKKINSPQITSVGRLFDAAAALIGVCRLASFEGQGPMMLEAVCEVSDDYIQLPMEEIDDCFITNWQPLIPCMQDKSLSVGKRAGIFHLSMANVVLQQAKNIRDKYRINSVCLSGGVFQNKVLTEQALLLLEKNNFRVTIPGLMPVNDAAISFGQVVEYGYRADKNSL